MKIVLCLISLFGLFLNLSPVFGKFEPPQDTPIGAAIGKDDTVGFQALLGEEIWRGLKISESIYLHWAAYANAPKIAGMLIARGIDVNLEISEDSKERARPRKITALMVAAAENHKEIIKLLIEKGALLEKQNADGRTALLIAIQEDSNDAARVLIENNASLQIVAYEKLTSNNQIEKRQTTPLILAASKNNVEILCLLIEKNSDLNTQVSSGLTALSEALVHKSDECAEVLIKKGASLTANILIKRKNGGRGSVTPLIWAAMHDRFKVIKVLIGVLKAKNANLDAPSYRGETALHLALGNQSFLSAIALIEEGADIEAITQKNGKFSGHKIAAGSTPLMLAAMSNNTEILPFLLAKNPKLEAQNYVGETALHVAIRTKATAVARLLIEKGANIEATTCWSLYVSGKNFAPHTTPLMLAASFNDVQTLTLLIEKGANVNVQDSGELTALCYALLHTTKECTEILIKKSTTVEILTAILKIKAKLDIHHGAGEMSSHAATPAKAKDSTRILKKTEPSQKNANLLELIGSIGDQKERHLCQTPPLCSSCHGIFSQLHSFLADQKITLEEKLVAELTQMTTDKPFCICNEQFLDLADLLQQSQQANWQLSAAEAFNLYFSTGKFNQEWTQQATLANNPIQIGVNLKADKAFCYAIIENANSEADSLARENAVIVVLPDGSMLVNYKSEKLGEGSYKQALQQFHLTKSPRGPLNLTPFVALKPRLSTKSNKRDANRKAVKMLKAEYQTYKTIATQLREYPELSNREALATADFIDLGDARSFIAQKLYDGSLKASDWWNDQTESGKLRALQILSALSKGLSQLHKIGLVHADIKEDNVLIDKKANKAVLADFGLTFDPKKERFNRGTPRYFSPGCMRCSYARAVSSKSTIQDFQKTDIYAFGVMALHTVPNFETDCLYCRCESDLGYFSKEEPDSDWNEEITQNATILYRQVRRMALEACKGQNPSSCKEKIIADCLNPDPTLRPTAEVLALRFEQALALNSR
jgi:ankyrin repeat protein